MSPPAAAYSRSMNIAGRRCFPASSVSRARWPKNTPSPMTMSASTFSLDAVEKAPANSAGVRDSRTWSRTCNERAAVSASLKASAWAELFGLERTATRDSPGTASLSSCRFLAISSGTTLDSPVMFPPGLERLAASPLPTGSPAIVMTTGIVDRHPGADPAISPNRRCWKRRSL